MKNKRFSVEQIVAVLKQVELGVPVAEVYGWDQLRTSIYTHGIRYRKQSFSS